jgi:hypothetical protein
VQSLQLIYKTLMIRMASLDKPEYLPHSCHHCQAVTITISHNLSVHKSFTEQGTLDVTCAQARNAAGDGCELFKFLMQSSPGERESDDRLRYTLSCDNLLTPNNSISFLYPATSQDLEMYAGDGGTSDSFPTPPNLTPGSNDAATNWLASCVQGHPDCARVNDVFAPPRLLYVADTGDQVHLVRMDAKKPVPYAVLSYCWGGDQIFKTTKSNVDKIHRALKDLPQTIQDAVQVTRQLQLDYLWVDSMCIIQDSIEDKSALVSQMHKIYACAHVTIAASVASKCTEGFLAPRTNILQFRIPINYRAGADASYRVGSIVLTPGSRGSIEPLVTRAWTLQESLLSRRILSYGSRQLRWFCVTDERCDGGVLDRDSANFASFQTLEETAIDLPRRRLKAKTLPKDPTSLPWLQIVEQYAKRDISVSSDKLVAISAVAQRLDIMTKGEWGSYHAGIWQERFFEQLLWAMSTGEIAKKIAEYRAPSWSWASVDGKPKWPWMEHLVDIKISCKLMGVKTQPLRSEEPFGAVTMGELKVSGKVKDAVWSADRKTLKDSSTQAAITDKVMQTFPDTLEDGAQDMTVHVLEIAKRSSLEDSLDVFNIRRKSTAAKGKYVGGILLVQVSDEVYRRVGFVGLRSTKVDTIALPLKWAMVENKKWWSEGFTSKVITIV